jgi:hypothetical protein
MANTFMRKTVIAALTFGLHAIAHAAPLYQWKDQDGSTRMTAEAPPAHATHISRVFQNEPPPMKEKVTQPALVTSSILTPQDQYSANANRRLQDSIQQMRAEEDYRRQRAMAEEEARSEELRAADEDYNYGYEPAYRDYNDYHAYSQSASISSSSAYRRSNDLASGGQYGTDDSAARAAAADAASKAADAASKAANAIGSVLGKR